MPARSPVFNAAFPASWNGTGTTVTDLSGANNTGFQSGTASFTTAAVPPGALAGTGSMALSWRRWYQGYADRLAE